MKTFILNLWDRLRNSLWLVPSLGLTLAMAAALGLLQLDSAVRVERIYGLRWATTTGPAARATLSTLAGALVTVTGVVFSITMLTLAQTSAMYGSRLLRSFLNHNITQFTLAMFLGTSLYCFMILRTIREIAEGDVFVPHISVGVGLLFGLGNLAMFVYFIHHVAQSIQAQTVVRNVAMELDDAIDRIFPEDVGDEESQADLADKETAAQGDDEEPPPAEIDESHTVAIESQHIGYIQAINGESLLAIATDRDLIIRLRRKPGDFLSSGMPLAIVSHAPQDEDDSLQELINDCVLVGTYRTPRQDVGCAIQDLVEVAVRALSPGINDPHTAIACIDYLGAGLIRLTHRPMPSPFRRDEKHRVRVIVDPITFADALHTAFDEIRQHGRTTTSVTIRIADTFIAIARKVHRPADCEALLHQTEMLDRSCQNSLPEEDDRSAVQSRLRQVRKMLDRNVSSSSDTRNEDRETTTLDVE